MTEKEEIRRQRQYALTVSGGRCEVCGKPLSSGQPQASHRIGQTKENYRKYGSYIINHPLNVGYCCSLKCNGKLDISYNPKARLMLLADIITYELKHFDYDG